MEGSRDAASEGRPQPGAAAWLVVAVAMGFLAACAGSPADREANRQAWEARDAQRALECQREGGRYFDGSCTRGGP
jgi:hypothetical protein